MKARIMAIAVLILTVTIGVIPGPVHAINLTLSPMQGMVGTEVSIPSICSYGTGEYGIYWGDANELIKQGVTEGCQNVLFTVPESPRGTVKVTLRISNKQFEAEYKIQPSISISATTGTVGGSVTVTGKGFNNNESEIQVLFDRATAQPGIKADRKGNWQSVIKIPAARSGDHIIDAMGVTPAEEVADKIFTIFPRLDITPTNGGVGAMVNIEGNGFAAGEAEIRVLYDEVSVKTGIGANSIGSWRASFYIPTSAKGMHRINAYGATTTPGKAAGVTFTISPTIRLELASVPLGATIRAGDKFWINGIGFEENESGIQVTFDGTMMTSGVVADAKGSWAVQLEVPPGNRGEHTINAYGDTTKSSDVPPALLMISPKLEVSPAMASVGQDVIVRGTGFGRNQPLTISFDGTLVAQAKQTDAKGGFSAEFKVPNSKSGSHTITCTDPTAAVASIGISLETTAPKAPNLIAPEAGGSIEAFNKAKVPFRWEPVEDPSGVNYILEISRTPDFSTIIFHKDGLEKSEYTLKDNEVLASGEYYWRVKAKDGAGNESAWITAQVFTVSGFDLTLLVIIFIVGAAIVGLITWRIMHISRRGGWK